jgi:ABC-2 type transport system permease protein
MTKMMTEPKPSPVESTPSRVEEKEPKIARIVGIAAVFFVLAGTFMWYWNAHVKPESPPFRPFFIRLWWVLGFCGMIVHALRDREVIARRGYGLLGYALMTFGLMTTAISIASQAENPTLTGVIAGVLGLFVVIATAVPFVHEASSAEGEPAAGPGSLQELLRSGVNFFPRWWATLKTSNRVQQATIVGLVAAVLFIIAGYSVNRFGALPFGGGALVGGFIFLVAFTTTERDMSWRGAAVAMLGMVGLAGALAALVPLFIMPLQAAVGVEQMSKLAIFGLPPELVFGVIAVVFLATVVGIKGSDSESGHTMALLLFGIGVLACLVGLARSLVPGIQFRPESLRVPAGFLSVVGGGLAALVGAALAFDNRVLVLMRRELASYFSSAVAYIVLFSSTVLAWWAFKDFLELALASSPQLGNAVIPEPVVAGYYINWLPVIFCLIGVGPAITMRLFSEENRTGTLEVLLTAPVGETSVVLAKFLAAWFFYLVTWVPWIVYPLAFRYMGGEEFDTRPMMSYLLGISFSTAGFVSMGLLFSSLTKNQIIAFILTAVGMVLITFLFFAIRSAGGGPDTSPLKVRLLEHVSYIHHLIEFTTGKVALHYLLYHASFTVLCLFVTVKVLEARKWR